MRIGVVMRVIARDHPAGAIVAARVREAVPETGELPEHEHGDQQQSRSKSRHRRVGKLCPLVNEQYSKLPRYRPP